MSGSCLLSDFLQWDEERLIRMYRHLGRDDQLHLRLALAQALLNRLPLGNIGHEGAGSDDDAEDESVDAWLAAGYPDVAYRLIEDGAPDADELEYFATKFEAANAWLEAAKCWEEAADQTIDETRCLNALRATEAFLNAKDWTSAARQLEIANSEHRERYVFDEEYASIGARVGKLCPGELFERDQDWEAAGEWYDGNEDPYEALRCFEHAEKWDRCAEIAEELKDREMLARFSERCGDFETAAECHEAVGSFNAAASCYARAGQWDLALAALACTWLDNRAADAITLLTLTESWGRLADHYRCCENWELASSYYERHGDLRQAAECYELAGKWADSGRCLEMLATNTSPQLPLFPEMVAQEQVALLKMAAVAFVNADEIELAKRCLDRIGQQ